MNMKKIPGLGAPLPTATVKEAGRSAGESFLSYLRNHPAASIVLRLAPVLFWMLMFLLIPLALVLVVSLATRGVYGGVVYKFTFENYIRFIDPIYLKLLIDSVYVALLTTLACLGLGYPFAYYVARSNPKYRNLLLMLVMLPFWTNFLIRTYAWMVILRTEGVINTVLQNLGLIQDPLSLLYNQGAVLLGMIYGYLPFMVLPLYASIEKLDQSLLEAAQDLGANPVQTFWKVTLPLTLPGVAAGSILVFVPALGMFVVPDLLGGAKSMLVGNLIQNQFLAARNWPFGAAASIIVMVVSLVMVFLYARWVGMGSEPPRAKEV